MSARRRANGKRATNRTPGDPAASRLLSNAQHLKALLVGAQWEKGHKSRSEHHDDCETHLLPRKGRNRSSNTLNNTIREGREPFSNCLLTKLGFAITQVRYLADACAPGIARLSILNRGESFSSRPHRGCRASSRRLSSPLAQARSRRTIPCEPRRRFWPASAFAAWPPVVSRTLAGQAPASGTRCAASGSWRSVLGGFVASW